MDTEIYAFSNLPCISQNRFIFLQIANFSSILVKFIILESEDKRIIFKDGLLGKDSILFIIHDVNFKSDTQSI